MTKLLSWLIGLFLFLLLFYILGDIFIVSFKNISYDYLFDNPYSAGRKGGIFPIIVSTLSILFVCLMLVVPVGIATALYLSQYDGPVIVRKGIEILSGVPSIVFGLFGNALFCVYFDFGFSILSGGLTLGLMSLPLFITTFEKGLSSVPTNYLLVAKSLGMSKMTTIKCIILPYALPSFIVAIVLSVGRSLAETAALVFTSGYVDRMPESFLDSGRALSVHIYDLTMNVPGGDINAYKSSFILILMIFFTNSFLNTALRAWQRKRIAL